MVCDASFGGLNLNIFGERISDELKLNYSFDTDVENIVLKRSSENGFYLEIENISGGNIDNAAKTITFTSAYINPIPRVGDFVVCTPGHSFYD